MGRGVSTSCSSMTVRHPSREERALWRAAMRDVAPLASVGAAPPPAETPVELPPGPTRTPPHPGEAPPRRRREPGAGLDRRSADRLRRGQLAIEARLDLHGLTQAEAHRALDDFVARAHDGGKRCVLVITGKSGVLREAVPRWLHETPSRGRVLGFTPAQPRDGGAGALYLLLRRRR